MAEKFSLSLSKTSDANIANLKIITKNCTIHLRLPWDWVIDLFRGLYQKHLLSIPISYILNLGTDFHC